MINAMVVCLRGARNVDVLFVYFRCTCLMERDSSRTGYNVMHVLRHVIEQLVSHYEMEQRVVANMTGNAPYGYQASAISNSVDDGPRPQTIETNSVIGQGGVGVVAIAIFFVRIVTIRRVVVLTEMQWLSLMVKTGVACPVAAMNSE